MKKLVLAVVFLLILSGCQAGGGEKIAPQISEFYKNKSDLAFSVTLRTDFGDRVIDFGLSYSRTPEGGQTLEVTSPELIKGITAKLTGDGTTLIYDGLELELGRLPDVSLSPLETLPFIVNQWANGRVVSVGKEKMGGKSCHMITYKTGMGETELVQHAWFTEDDFAPVLSELYANGTMIARAAFG